MNKKALTYLVGGIALAVIVFVSFLIGNRIGKNKIEKEHMEMAADSAATDSASVAAQQADSTLQAKPEADK